MIQQNKSKSCLLQLSLQYIFVKQSFINYQQLHSAIYSYREFITVKIQINQWMSTKENRKVLSVVNQTLKADHSSLKNRHFDLLSHVQTLMRRQKQLFKLKEQLLQQLHKAQANLQIVKNQKQPYCKIIQKDILNLSKQTEQKSMIRNKLEQQYQICLKQYDNILSEITSWIQQTRIVELQLIQQKEKDATLKAMVFDYERLHRVLQQQRKYFKNLTNNQQKTHAQRMKQFEQIRNKLIKEENQSGGKNRIYKLKLGLIKVSELFKNRFEIYAQHFLRGHGNYLKKIDLGIKTLGNCLKLADFKVHQTARNFFFKWHNNTFNKHTLSNIVQNALINDVTSKIKIKTLNRFIERINSDNLSLLHLYQRTKIIVSTSNAINHKQLHFYFTKWRDNSAKISLGTHYLNQVINKTIPNIQIRLAFNDLKNNSALIKRFQTAEHLLDQYQKSKELSYGLRKWRLQIHNMQMGKVRKYVQNINMLNMITKRVNYQKRKVRIITTLQLNLSKIQMRNYFMKYWDNVKQFKIRQIQKSIISTKQLFSQKRIQQKCVQKKYTQKNRNLCLKIFRNFAWKNKINPYFKKWKNTSIVMSQRNKLIFGLALKREGRNKLYVMNEFRRLVQYFQKKQMHQVLTDLNKKMETINQKSTQFREALKICIQNLGVQSSKKINQVFQYSLNCQKRVYFDWNCRMSIKKKFKYYLIVRSLDVFNKFAFRNGMKNIQQYGKCQYKYKVLQQRQQKYIKQLQVKSVRKCFNAILKQLKIHKKAFAKLIHAENVMYFYRLQCAFLAIAKKSHFQNVKQQKKKLLQLTGFLKGKQQNQKSLLNDKSKLQDSLKEIFKNFINFEDRSIRNRQKNKIEQQKRKYFQKYRQNVFKKQQSKQILQSFFDFFEYKNLFIFWKALLITKYQNIQNQVKDQLGKINKKKKAFDQKAVKAKGDLLKKLQEQQNIHKEHLEYYEYYFKKYNQILNYYNVRHDKIQQKRYTKTIFTVWKRQCLGAKKIGNGINNILRRHHLIKPYQYLFNEFKKYDYQYRAQLKCANILQKKGKRLMKDGMSYWRFNMRHGYCDKIKNRIDNIDDYHEEIRSGCVQKAQLMANQFLRCYNYKLDSKVFLTLKNQWKDRKNYQRIIFPFTQKCLQNRLKNALNNWKWLMFYKKTKRSFLKYKKEKMNKELKRDVFNSLNIYRQEMYYFAQLSQNYIFNEKYQRLRFRMSKIINFSNHSKNQLIFQRRRAIHSLLMSKMTRQKLIKRKIMWKWQSWLIPRTHYLPNVIKNLQIKTLKSSFAKINQYKYWNQYYIKDKADQVTTKGYSQVNTVTNILIRQGFDPDELKGYLKKRNQKDTKMIKQVINHLKTWPQKQIMVRAFHSWKEYLQIKKNIKRILTKVFNFSSGLGRYFNKWRSKDPHFNQILQKQSRGNMLNRYKQLQRFLKQYKRDIKDSLQNCQQLKQINDEHAKSTRMTVEMALSCMSNSVKKGIFLGFQIWREKVREFRSQEYNEKYDQLSQGIQMLSNQKYKIKNRITSMKKENQELKKKCEWGAQCGALLKRLLSEKDSLTINLVDKQHNLKLLLEDNIRLKQKIRTAQENALKLIDKVNQDSHFAQINLD